MPRLASRCPRPRRRRGSRRFADALMPRAEPVDVADDRIERGRREHAACRGCSGVASSERGARAGVREQPVERRATGAARRSGSAAPHVAASVDASAASSSSSSCARSRRRRGSTSATSALVGQQVGEQVLVGGQPRQPRLHAVEHLALGEPLPLLAAPRLGARAARPRGRAPRRSGAARAPGTDHASATSSCERWSATENCESRSTSSPQRSMRTGMVGGRRVDVDDRAAHRELAARLDLVLAPVAHRDEPLDELVAVDLVAGRERRSARRPRRAGRAAARARGPGATTTAGRCSPPARSRHITRRRRPIVSIAGDTRSNGSVSHAGNSSTASAPRNCRRSPASRSASAPRRHREQRPAGARSRRASVAAKMARAGSGTATVCRRPELAATIAGSSASDVVSPARGGVSVMRSRAIAAAIRVHRVASTYPGCELHPGRLSNLPCRRSAYTRRRWVAGAGQL